MYNMNKEIKVEVKTRFFKSDKKVHGYFWVYDMKIINTSNKTMQVITKYLTVVDEAGNKHEFTAKGVLGDCILLHPEDEIEYSSGIPLFSPSGIGSGKYLMTSELGEDLYVEIPVFSLDSPYSRCSIH